MGNCTGKQKKLYPGSKTYIMYHGTTMKNALKIYDKGFRQSSGGMLGCGVYVSRSKEKASHYPVYDKGEPLAILKVEVQVGKVKRIDYQGHPLQKTWNLHGYDTAWVPPNCGMVHSGLEEDCVYDPSRIKAGDSATGMLDMQKQPPAHLRPESLRREVLSFPVVSYLISPERPVSSAISPALLFRLINASTLLTAVED
ncbi:hypothetical protein QQF64_015321 [Cirrhinus molitorella]|uniref:PARP catalytic domain-containing protein n=1 Tax=Cirrhinus molitorella TaxID=172907 RepID=A0ABR3NUL5_9TELE